MLTFGISENDDRSDRLNCLSAKIEWLTKNSNMQTVLYSFCQWVTEYQRAIQINKYK